MFSWFYFGSAIPDTFAMKASQDGWGGPFVTGLLGPLPAAVPARRLVSVHPSAAAGLDRAAGPARLRSYRVPARGRCRSRRQASPALAYFGFYCWLRVPPYFWYYGIPLGAVILVARLGDLGGAAHVLFAGRGVAWVRAAAGVVAALLVAPAAVDLAARTCPGTLPLREAPIHGNWALTDQYRQIGLDLDERLPDGAVVRSAGEFAVILYYCDCTLLDRFDDRALIKKTLIDAKDDRRLLMRLNYRRFDPDDYPRHDEDFHLALPTGHGRRPAALERVQPDPRARPLSSCIEGPRAQRPDERPEPSAAMRETGCRA